MSANSLGAADDHVHLARTALRAARQAARSSGNVPVQCTIRQAMVVRRGPREPEPIADVFTDLVAAHGWTLDTAGGGLRNHWPAIVGTDAAAHWHLAGYDPSGCSMGRSPH